MILLILLRYTCLYPQSLTFTQPMTFLKGAASDKAIDITNFRQHYFATWKSIGNNGSINVSYLGTRADTAFVQTSMAIPDAVSGIAPVFRTTDNHIYLFWITKDGTVKYIVNTSDTGFAMAPVHTLSTSEPVSFTKGINAAFVGKKVMLASHTDNKDGIFIAISQPGKDGILENAAIVPVKGAKSPDYPFVVPVSDQAQVRCSWVDIKDRKVYYADFDPSLNTWSTPRSLPDAASDIAPALYSVFHNDCLFYIWNCIDRKGQLAYLTQTGGTFAGQQTYLPAYFSTDNPVSVSYVDQNNFIMGFTGKDHQLYISYFSAYDPASWIGDLLYPGKADYSLRDIVIPGAHDAGMSVLSGTGGSESGSINECNTLTQSLKIEKQLQAGIRMFDLRIDKYNGQLYTKHSSSDCMEDAIGGGWGESINEILNATKTFLNTNKKEFVILNFSHFCERHIPVKEQARLITDLLGKEYIYYRQEGRLADTKLKNVAGKVIVLFENYAYPDLLVDSGTMTTGSKAFINYRREYAATNDLQKLLTAQQLFFKELKGNIHDNDLVRLDWQLTEAGSEAAMICNEFQSEKTNPLVDGVLLLTNVIKHHKSIITLSLIGNRYLAPKVVEWIRDGTINRENKPNILYVDVAGSWITDFCIDLNRTPLYSKQPD
ncbi:PI-PLC domain-containing protein [Chitinophaga tropicalis]|uniref:Phosphatidylinositol diacylglycerol-lyase n=1 Tax=Chitinophaga tropicalis TaxID=2683588 RepID=A0A7K1U5C2_9BACT|nr:hypothetical protein [Chitinophaga tropicalis]MVT09476.1 hypothetical protein [Chitinophaga tropicalis]